MSCPWANIQKPEPVNFEEIMSEEVARDLQDKEDQKYLSKFSEDVNEDIDVTSDIPGPSGIVVKQDLLLETASGTCQSDEEIARILQMQFDKEHDEVLERTAEKINGGSKVSVSFGNFKRAPLNFDFESDPEEDEIEDIRERKDWDRFDANEREFRSIPPCGYKVKTDGNLVTKHDVTMTGRKNACKLLSFPPEFHTGDGEYFDLKLSNKVFNSLKLHSQHEQSRRHQIRDKKEDQATSEFGLDRFTRLLLYKMVNNAVLEQIDGVISIGKEAVILYAEGNPEFEQFSVPKECVIKVYKTTLSEFKQRDKYIKDDRRFKDRIGNQTARKTVHLWAEKEMSNLYRLKKAGVPCPQVVTIKKHVLVMSFIGEDRRPAAKLKDADLSDAEYIIAYEQVVENMKKLFSEADLIHADLSEYNILWHNDTCYFIDVSQSVLPIHENAFYFLMRDCNNISKFFERKLVPGVLSANELFKLITGYDYSDKQQLLALETVVKMKPHLVDKFEDEMKDDFEKTWEAINDNAIAKLVDSAQVLVDPAVA